jgi:hypothetical protein
MVSDQFLAWVVDQDMVPWQMRFGQLGKTFWNKFMPTELTCQFWILGLPMVKKPEEELIE